MSFERGEFIEVVYTDNVLARFPTGVVGSRGIVEQAPIHPSTWFTVKMVNGRLIKLQTTAMKHINKADNHRCHSEMIEKIYAPLANKSTKQTNIGTHGS